METTATTTASSSSGKKTNAAANKSTKAGNNASINSVGTDASSKASRAAEELTVTPREGCMEVRKMRLRVRLFCQHKPWDPTQPNQRGSRQEVATGKDNNDPISVEGGDKNNADNDDGYDSDTPGADGWNDNALVVRRRNTLLVTTRRGMGALVFHFKSTQDCLDFCDRLAYLNKDILHPSCSGDSVEDTDTSKKKRSRSSDDDGYVNGLDTRDLHMDDIKGIKRHRGAVFGDNDIPERRLLLAGPENNKEKRSGRGILEEAPPGKSEDIKQCARQEEMMSFIVRLAHSEEFRGFVDELERGLESAGDTAAIHAALGY